MKEMYEGGKKSETSLARAVHILTLGAFAWEEDSSDVIEIGVSANIFAIYMNVEVMSHN